MFGRFAQPTFWQLIYDVVRFVLQLGMDLMKNEFETYVLTRMKALGLSKAEVHRRGNNSFSRPTMDDWIHGKTKSLDIWKFSTFSSVLGVAPYYLLKMYYASSHIEMQSESVATLAGDHSSFVDDVNVPDNSVVHVNQEFTKTWALQNTGKRNWENRVLICVDDVEVVSTVDDLLKGSFLVPENYVVPIPQTAIGEVVNISVRFRAPKYPCTIRSLWRIADSQGIVSFPEQTGVWCQVKVVSI